MIRLISPSENEKVCLQTAVQMNFASNSRDYAQSEIDWRNLTQTTETDCTIPNSIRFVWEAEGAARLQIAASPDFAMPLWEQEATGSAEVYNLLIGKRYYWRVICGEMCSAVRAFETESRSPRWIYVDGLTNVRDMGGWKTMDGRRMRQGLLYRGSEMDIHREITQEGIATMRDVLGIKTDLDVREEVVGKRFESPLGADIAFELIPICAYGEFVRDTAPYPRLFEILADRDRYPIYFHCWGGADRTGSLACILEALCGVSDADQDLDYELTTLSVWGKRSSRGAEWRAFHDALASFGTSRMQQARAFLRQAGVTDETMDRIVKILVED